MTTSLVEERFGPQVLTRIAAGATLVGAGVGVWGGFLPWPYELVVAVLLATPWAALVLSVVTGGRLNIMLVNSKTRPTIFLLWALPMAALCYRSADVRVLDTMPWLEWVAAVGMGLTLVLWLTNRTQLPKQLPTYAGLLAISIVYSWCAVTELNALLDGAPSTTYRTPVASRWTTGSRSRAYYLRLAQWGPMPDVDDIRVNNYLYDRVVTGEVVCVALHPGVLGLRWYQVTECGSTSSPAARQPLIRTGMYS